MRRKIGRSGKTCPTYPTKVRYRDLESAVRAMKISQSKSTRQTVPQRAYECHACDGFHLTSRLEQR